MRWVSGPDLDDPDGANSWHQMRLHAYLRACGVRYV
jgi:hypothetical protein